MSSSEFESPKRLNRRNWESRHPMERSSPEALHVERWRWMLAAAERLWRPNSKICGVSVVPAVV
eukprot:10814090-Alexandrium_andersonii.AAC.1